MPRLFLVPLLLAILPLHAADDGGGQAPPPPMPNVHLQLDTGEGRSQVFRLENGKLVPVPPGEAARSARPAATADPVDAAADTAGDDAPAATPPAEIETVSWLGVGLERSSRTLQEQLELDVGLGLVITHVAPDSPAAAAGLQAHDVLVSLDEQLLVNPEQFMVLIRRLDAGTAITLDYRRGGKAASTTATLVAKEVPVARGAPGRQWEQLADWLRDRHGADWSSHQSDDLLRPGSVPQDQLDEQTRKTIERWREHIEQNGGDALGFATPTVTRRFSSGNFRAVTANEDYRVALEVTDGQRRATINSSDGTELYAGDVAGAAQAGLPAAALQLLDQVERMHGSSGAVPLRLQTTPENTGVPDDAF